MKTETKLARDLEESVRRGLLSKRFDDFSGNWKYSLTWKGISLVRELPKKKNKIRSNNAYPANDKEELK